LVIKIDKKVIQKTKSTKKTRPKADKAKTVTKQKRLLEFWGRECPHCKAMSPLIEKLKEGLRVKVEQLEVWHNEKNALLYAQYDKGLCGGVPFFFNEATGEWLCGEASYDALKAWVRGKKKKG
jgi:thiol-disulfide isomerase/thioredoxin